MFEVREKRSINSFYSDPKILINKLCVKNENKIQDKIMICPNCNLSDMFKKPLQETIDNGLVKTRKDIDVQQSLMDELIENSEYAVCHNCKFVMIPPIE